MLKTAFWQKAAKSLHPSVRNRHMADMQHVKTTVGHHQPPALGAHRTAPFRQRLPGNYLLVKTHA